jgi:hypothetical protein
MIMGDDKKGTCALIDEGILGARNVIQILKYNDFTIEKRRMWKVITKMIAITMATIGMIQNLSENI